MNIIKVTLLLAFILSSSLAHAYDGSTTASVVLAGGIIKSQHTENVKKYKRKDCPVCRGKGWYISGDNISRVPCGYCEPETEEKAITHPPIIIRQKAPVCNGPNCQMRRQ